MKNQTSELFEMQLARLKEPHFLILYWAMSSEDRGVKYNITNVFDDLKSAGVTRTKQTAVAVVAALEALCLIDLRDEHNRKNVYLTRYGGLALKHFAEQKSFEVRKSQYLENLK
jgi:hypothetical protein